MYFAIRFPCVNFFACAFCVILTTANLLLQDTIERIHVGNEYGDIPRGIFIVRGENLVLLGEIVSLSLLTIYNSYIG